jgi:hypothetical protein
MEGLKKRGYFIIFVIVLILSPLILFFISYFNYVALGPVEGECISLVENEGEGIDIVFMTENVSEEKVGEYIDYFLNSAPFSDNDEKFNFYYAGDAYCDLYHEKAVFCYSRENIMKSSICPNDYIVVLSERSAKIRSSAYMNLISLNVLNSKNVILHEFGHVFANLADEYVPSIIPGGSENCAEKCDYFLNYGNSTGCYLGCSEAEYKRSSEISVMRSTKTNDYGTLNSFLIEKNLGEY